MRCVNVSEGTVRTVPEYGVRGGTAKPDGEYGTPSGGGEGEGVYDGEGSDRTEGGRGIEGLYSNKFK